jgi:hypothetical protein
MELFQNKEELIDFLVNELPGLTSLTSAREREDWIALTSAREGEMEAIAMASYINVADVRNLIQEDLLAARPVNRSAPFGGSCCLVEPGGMSGARGEGYNPSSRALISRDDDGFWPSSM